MRTDPVEQLHSEIFEDLSYFCGRGNTVSRDNAHKSFTKSAVHLSDRLLSSPQFNQQAVSEQIGRSTVGSWIPRRF